MYKKFYTCRSDILFKAIICNDSNKKYLLAILNTIFKREFKDVTIVNSGRLKNNLYTRGKTVDLIIKEDDATIIIELNSKRRNEYRNFAYLCNEIANQTKVGEEYSKNYQFYQINLTYNMKDDLDCRTYKVQDDYCKQYVENVFIIEYNMDKLMNYFYNNDKEKIEEYKYLIMLDLEEEKLNNLEKGNETIMEYKKEVVKLNSNPEYVEFLTQEEDDEKMLNTIKREAREEGLKEGFDEGIEQGKEQGIKQGIKQGIEQGVNQNKILVINNLNKQGSSIDFISKVVELPEEEVKRIIEDSNN